MVPRGHFLDNEPAIRPIPPSEPATPPAADPAPSEAVPPPPVVVSNEPDSFIRQSDDLIGLYRTIIQQKCSPISQDNKERCLETHTMLGDALLERGYREMQQARYEEAELYFRSIVDNPDAKEQIPFAVRAATDELANLYAGWAAKGLVKRNEEEAETMAQKMLALNPAYRLPRVESDAHIILFMVEAYRYLDLLIEAFRSFPLKGDARRVWKIKLELASSGMMLHFIDAWVADSEAAGRSFPFLRKLLVDIRDFFRQKLSASHHHRRQFRIVERQIDELMRFIDETAPTVP